MTTKINKFCFCHSERSGSEVEASFTDKIFFIISKKDLQNFFVYCRIGHAVERLIEIYAEVVELADASDSKSDPGCWVWVQVPPSAPAKKS